MRNPGFERLLEVEVVVVPKAQPGNESRALEVIVANGYRIAAPTRTTIAVLRTNTGMRPITRFLLLPTMNVAFVALSAPGHLNPMTALARQFQSRGHEVVLISLPEALAQGVPQVAIPVTHDQPGVASRIAAKKTGVVGS